MKKYNWESIQHIQEAWGNRFIYRIKPEHIKEFTFICPGGPCKGQEFYGYPLETGRGTEIRSLKFVCKHIDGSIDVSEFESIGD